MLIVKIEFCSDVSVILVFMSKHYIKMIGLCLVLEYHLHHCFISGRLLPKKR